MKKMFKVLCPLNKKDGSTYWMRIGTGFTNKDGSVNINLDAFPREGRLQLREFDERDFQRGKEEGADSSTQLLASMSNLGYAGGAAAAEQLPF